MRSGTSSPASEPIAILGVGCRFPGAPSSSLFWRMLRDGLDGITEVPPHRFDIESIYDPTPGTPGKVSSRWGGFVDRPEDFDAAFFGISPREAARMDPQSRMLLEAAWEALEQGGQVPAELAGGRVAVYVGMITNDYEDLQYCNREGLDMYVIAGSTRSNVAGRLSYTFDFHGPSMVVDTACSSSLTSVHLACQSLRSGESDLALAGGVSMVLHPALTIGFSQGNSMALDGRCKFGDARADGFVRSDGIGIVLLKPLARALEDGDPVQAVILGSSVQHDGRGESHYMRPNVEAQLSTLREAYQLAGVDPRQVQFIEAHGTGTAVGDPIELEALAAVLGEGRPAERPLKVSSVKSNIGHTEAAAGVAGLIKTALALRYRTVPPSLHFEEPNPGFDWDGSPVSIPSVAEPWPETDGPAFAAVNSSGLTGINAHLVLREAETQTPAASTVPGPYLLPITGRTAEARQEMARRYRSMLAGDLSEEHGHLESTAAPLADIASTAGLRRTHHEHRLALVGSDRAEMMEELDAYLRGESRPGHASGSKELGHQHRVVFIFPGQGSQWVGMGRELLAREPAFAREIDAWDDAVRRETGWSVREVLTTPEGAERLGELDVVQPTLVAVEAALAALWRAYGVEPDVVLGHSMGETAAAYVAGILSLEDAAAVICRRSRAAKRLRGQGAMLVVGLSMEEAQQAVSGFEDRLSIAVSNSPASTVLSGASDAVDEVAALLEAKDVFCRRVNVDFASHSPQMEELREELLERLAGLAPQTGQVPFFSSVTGELLSGGELDTPYWYRNLRQPVLFSSSVQSLLASGHDVFIEMTPHPILLSAIQQTLRDTGSQILLLSSGRREEDEKRCFLQSLGALYASGYDLDWSRLYGRGGRVVDLPFYAWQRDHLWFVEDDVVFPPLGKAFNRGSQDESLHPLLGRRLTPAMDGRTHFWEAEVSLRDLPYLHDHRVQGAAVFPGAAYVEMALAAARQVAQSRSDGEEVWPRVEAVRFHRALFLADDEVRRVQLVLVEEAFQGPVAQGSYRFFGLEGGVWTLLSEGRVAWGEDAEKAAETTDLKALQTQLSRRLDGSQLYPVFERGGLQYGPAFQGIYKLWLEGDQALARVRLPDPIQAGVGAYGIHPALLDAAFQALATTLVEGEGDDESLRVDTWLPVTLERAELLGQPGRELWSRVVPRGRDGDVARADLLLLRPDGSLLGQIQGLEVQRLDRQDLPVAETDAADLLYQLEWKLATLPTEEVSAEPGTWLLFCDRGHGVGEALAVELEARGERCLRAVSGAGFERKDGDTWEVDASRPEDYDALLAEVPASSLRGVVHLWSLDGAPTEATTLETLDADQLRGPMSTLHLLQALGRRGLESPPRLWLVTAGAHAAGLEPEASSVSQSTLWGLGRVLGIEHPELRPTLVDLPPGAEPRVVQALMQELRQDGPETQLALRPAGRFALRLVPAPARGTGGAESDGSGSLPWVPAASELPPPPPAYTRRSPEAGEVEIEVDARAPALGRPDSAGALSGRVLAAGPGVEGLAPGDSVVAVAPAQIENDRRHVTLDARLAVPRPQDLDPLQATVIPTYLLAAHYALGDLARLGEGESLHLVGGESRLGRAVLEIARHRRVSVVESEEASALFLASAEAGTSDLRLSPGTRVLAPALGAPSAPRADLGALENGGGLTVSSFDLQALAARHPEHLAQPLREVAQLAAAGTISPSVLAELAPEVTARVEAARTEGPRPDATYLITGGLGGLGLEVARWWVARGARSLVLLGRSEPGPRALAAIEALEAVGARVEVRRVDVGRAEQVAALVEEIDASPTPLAGVFHAAGVLDDALALQLTAEKLRSVMAAKVLGTWNLHQATRASDLDLFVLFSSVAGLVGSPGQGNYAAANTFLDALAELRREAGLPAVSIAWGAWSDVGLATAEGRGNRLAERGILSMSVAEGLAALERVVLSEPPPLVAAMAFDAELWRSSYAGARQSPFLEELAAPAPAHAEGAEVRLKARLLGVGEEERRLLLEDFLSRQIARILGLGDGEIGRVDVRQPINQMGIDSLMALEVKQIIERELGVVVPIVAFLQGPSLRELATTLLGELAQEPGTPALELAAGTDWEEGEL